MISVIELLIIIIILIVLFATSFGRKVRGYTYASYARKPSYRHPVPRLICGICGGIILITIAAVSRTESQSASKIDPADLKIELSTQPLDPVLFEANHREIKSGKSIILKAHHILAESYKGAFMPVQVETITMNWPEDRGKLLRKSYTWGKTKVQREIKVQDIRLSGERVFLSGNGKMKYKTTRSSGSQSGGLNYIEKLDVQRHFHHHFSGGSGKHFSLISNRKLNHWILTYFTAAESTEDFAMVSAADFIDTQKSEIDHKVREEEASAMHWPRRQPSPAMHAMQHFGANTFYLLLAAILFTQLFKRRDLAFAGMMLCMVLFVITLEHSMMRYQQDQVARPDNTPYQQAIAEAQLESFFFFKPEMPDVETRPSS